MEIKGSKNMNACMPLAIQFMGRFVMEKVGRNKEKEEKQYCWRFLAKLQILYII